MALLDVDGRFVEVNRALCDILDYAETELLTLDVSDVVHPADLDADRADAARLLTGDTASYQAERRYLRRNGGVVVGRLTTAAIGDEADAPRLILAMVQDVTPYKAEGAALRASEARLRLALEAAAMAVWEWDATTGEAHRSPGMPALFGLPPDAANAPRALYRTRIHPEDRPVLRGADRTLRAGAAEYEVEYRVVLPGSEVRWLRDRGEAVRGADGRLLRALGVTQDVTERKAAEAALLASERRHRTLVEQLPAAVYTHPLAVNEGMTYVSPRIADILGYASEEVLARPELFKGGVHPDDRAAAEAAEARSSATGEPFDVRYRVRHAAGHWVWLRDRAVLVRDDQGQPLHWQGLLTDVTAEVRAGCELRASEERLNEAQALAAVGSWEWDSAGARRWSPEMHRLFGFDPAAEPISDDQLAAVVHPDDRAILKDTLRRAWTEGGDFDVEVRVVRPGDGVRVLHGRGRAEPGPDGRPIRLLGTVQDVTERKEREAALQAAKEAAEAANRAKSAFLSTVSHELRTPLTAIVGYAELLLASQLGPEAEADAAQIVRSAGHLLELINGVLDLAKIESGRLELHLRDIAVADTIEEVRAEVAALAAIKGLDLITRVPAGLPHVQADAQRLYQVLLNLIGNAVKYTDEGSITIAARPAADGVEISVADTGIGIAPDDVGRVFEEFRQATASSVSKRGGAGLGLAIAKRLVEAHGGTIRVDSALGVGSTFAIRLPASVAPPSVEAWNLPRVATTTGTTR